MEWHSYTETDYQDISAFLGKLYQLEKNRPYWLPGRWEYATYLCSPLFSERGFPDWKPFIQVIRDRDSVVGVVNSENPDHNTYIHTHPKYRFLDDALIEWAENNFDTQKITVWCLDDDEPRKEILRTRGYRMGIGDDYLNWCSLEHCEPHVQLPSGFTYASFDDGFDLENRIDCSAKAFNSMPFSTDVYRFMQKAPSYDSTLDLVVKKGDHVVSLCTIWVDSDNYLAYFEPVATHPDFQRKGIGTSILHEGLRRLKEKNIPIAYVGAAGDWRKAFYYMAGFTESVKCKPWTKETL